MKIIGKTSAGKSLVEAADTELAQIMGFRYTHELKDRNSLDVGRDIQVSRLFDALSVERTRRADIAALATSLRKVADRVDSINTSLDCPIVEPQA